MRKLTKKQKRLIKVWYNKNKDKITYFTEATELSIYWEVYHLNRFENFDSVVENYVCSLITLNLLKSGQ